MTIKQIAEKIGKSPLAVRSAIHALKIQNEGFQQTGQRGRPSALYGNDAVEAVTSYFTQASAAEPSTL